MARFEPGKLCSRLLLGELSEEESDKFKEEPAAEEASGMEDEPASEEEEPAAEEASRMEDEPASDEDGAIASLRRYVELDNGIRRRGIIRFVDPARSYGFIKCLESGTDAWVVRSQLKTFKVGDKVCYDISGTEQNPSWMCQAARTAQNLFLDVSAEMNPETCSAQPTAGKQGRTSPPPEDLLETPEERSEPGDFFRLLRAESSVRPNLQSRSRSRSRSPSEAPQPKKMPKRKAKPAAAQGAEVLMPLTAKASAPAPPPLLPVPPRLAPPPSLRRVGANRSEVVKLRARWQVESLQEPASSEASASTNGCSLRARRQVAGAGALRARYQGQPVEQPGHSEALFKQQQIESSAFFNQFAGGGDLRSSAMAVLAHHCARHGPVAARGLEGAVRQAVEQASEAESGPWNFLQWPAGNAALQAATSAAVAVYSRRGGRKPEADKEVRWQLGILPFAELLGNDVVEIGFSEVLPSPPAKPEAPQGQKGELILLPISMVRFAHNDQSEHFVHASTDCTILQLAVELITGITPLEDVPTFNVCWHAYQWYCRSGNRRLAALSLATLFAPERFHCVWVYKVKTDSTFVHGGRSGRPKLTTDLNGEDCQGRWMVIKETGETVGMASALRAPPYGADLLSLLPRPCSHS